MTDLNCPYCDAGLNICHDDGFGYEEGVKHEMTCVECDKSFVFETSIIFLYESKKADCLNGGEHDFENVHHLPKYWPNWVRCNSCGYEITGEIDMEQQNDT